MFGLFEWWRKAELSADRAGLLAGQDPAAALRAHMKLAGGNDLREIDTAAFLEQAAEYDRGGDLRDSLIKLRMLFGLTHPLPVARAADLRRWIDDGHYARILGGDYPRREHDSDASVSADAKEAAEEYRRTFARSEDPLMGLLRRFGEGAGSVGEWMGAGAGRVRDWWASGGRPPTDPRNRPTGRRATATARRGRKDGAAARRCGSPRPGARVVRPRASPDPAAVRPGRARPAALVARGRRTSSGRKPDTVPS